MRPSVRLAVAAVGASLALTACGSASEPSPPTGVDQLVIPSPSLEAADFVDEVDNPWLPLAAGSEWVYRAEGDPRRTTVTTTVLDETRDVQGVTATVVRTVVTDGQGRQAEESVTWFAQDVDGNVWSLGEEGVWEAGVDRGEAGLAMPAEPRVGDGYRTEYLPGVAEGRAQVVALDGSASVPYDDLTGLLEIEVTTPLEPGVVVRRLYAPDVGLVREQAVAGGDDLLVLVRFGRS